MTDLTGNVDRDEFVFGIGTAFLLQPVMLVIVIVGGYGIGWAVPMAGIIGFYLPIAVWGAAQLIYILPAVIGAKSKGQDAYASGICAGATAVVIIHFAWMIQTRQIQLH